MRSITADEASAAIDRIAEAVMYCALCDRDSLPKSTPEILMTWSDRSDPLYPAIIGPLSLGLATYNNTNSIDSAKAAIETMMSDAHDSTRPVPDIALDIFDIAEHAKKFCIDMVAPDRPRQ